MDLFDRIHWLKSEHSGHLGMHNLQKDLVIDEIVQIIMNFLRIDQAWVLKVSQKLVVEHDENEIWRVIIFHLAAAA